MTLVARGCAFKNGGANSLIQAFLLSLTAATFTSQTTLEIALNPETELHRTIFVKNLQFGLVGFLNLTFDLDSSLTPFVLISSNASTLYACTAGNSHFLLILKSCDCTYLYSSIQQVFLFGFRFRFFGCRIIRLGTRGT